MLGLCGNVLSYYLYLSESCSFGSVLYVNSGKVALPLVGYFNQTLT